MDKNLSPEERQAFYVQDIAEENYKRQTIIRALRTRVLSPDEMDEVFDYGPHLCSRLGQSYFPGDIEHAFNELCFLQFRMRLETERGQNKTPPSSTG